MKEDKQKEIEFSFESKNVGKQRAYFLVEVEDGVPMSFMCEANFVGPYVRIVES
jgi:hypothetical protein